MLLKENIFQADLIRADAIWQRKHCLDLARTRFGANRSFKSSFSLFF